MSHEDPIAVYMRELKRHLRVRGLRRRRIVEEVECHLSQRRTDLQRDRGIEPRSAAMEAIQRFGAAEEMAAQFNRAPRRPRILERRLIALWVSWIAAMAMGTATVWAAVDSPGPSGHLGIAHRNQATRVLLLCSPRHAHSSNPLDLLGKTPILQQPKCQAPGGEALRCQSE